MGDLAKKAKTDGEDMKHFERELKRQQNRNKMDEFDAIQDKKLADEKKQGVDQVQTAAKEPV